MCEEMWEEIVKEVIHTCEVLTGVEGRVGERGYAGVTEMLHITNLVSDVSLHLQAGAQTD